MSDIKFSCPSCQQHIQCEQGYAGMEIACPACHAKMVVPGAVSAPALGLRMSAAAPPPPPAPPPAPAATGRTCPSCGNPVAPAAIMCIKCGTNLRTGQRMATPGRPGVVQKPVREVMWYTNPNVYAGAVLGILVAFYGFAWINPLGALAYVGFSILVSLAAAIIVLIAAFQDSVGTGFMTLCVPFYIFYFVYAKCDSPLAKALFSVGILGRVGVFLLPHGGN
jgi:hypothetical protein